MEDETGSDEVQRGEEEAREKVGEDGEEGATGGVVGLVVGACGEQGEEERFEEGVRQRLERVREDFSYARR